MPKHILPLLVVLSALSAASCGRKAPSFPSQTGSLAVSSTPSGAAIVLDGSADGAVTPHTFTGLPSGDHVVSVSLNGYAASPESRTVTVVAGATVAADFALTEQLPPSAKVVLLESFSNVDCVGCPAMAATLAGLMSEPGYGSDRVLLIKFSMNWPRASDPMYQANTADNQARLAYYMSYIATGGIPTLVGDGALLGQSGNPPDYNELVPIVDAMLAAEPGFSITVDAPVSGTEVPVNVTLTADRAVDLSGCTLDVALVENPLVFPSPPGSQGETAFHDVMRDFVISDETLPTLAAGDPVVLTATCHRDASWIPENLTVIAFVQNISTRAILQAGSTAGGTGAPHRRAHSARLAWNPPAAEGEHR